MAFMLFATGGLLPRCFHNLCALGKGRLEYVVYGGYCDVRCVCVYVCLNSTRGSHPPHQRDCIDMKMSSVGCCSLGVLNGLNGIVEQVVVVG